MSMNIVISPICVLHYIKKYIEKMSQKLAKSAIIQKLKFIYIKNEPSSKVIWRSFATK